MIAPLDLTEPLQLNAWIALSTGEQRAAIQRVLTAGLDRNLDLDSEVITPGGWLTFILKHRATGILLQFVPGGTFVRGFSEEEAQALRDELQAASDEDAAAALSFLDTIASIARPVSSVHVPPFLLAPAALDEASLAKLLNGPSGGLLPQTLTMAGADSVAKVLATHGLRLPSEAEHEFVYRAGSSQPFPWGKSRPKSPRVPSNRFGFERMAEMAEVCADGWHPGYLGAPIDGSARDPLLRPLTARGGSAEVWPWQGVGEWVAMLSSARSSSADHEGFLRVRPACSLGLPP